MWFPSLTRCEARKKNVQLHEIETVVSITAKLLDKDNFHKILSP